MIETKQNEKELDNKIPKPSIPKNLPKMVDEFIIRVYGKLDINSQIIQSQLLGDLEDVIVVSIDFAKIQGIIEDKKGKNLLKKIKKEFMENPKKIIEEIKYQICRYFNESNPDSQIEEKSLYLEYKNIEVFINIDVIDNFQKDLTKYVGKICKFKSRYMNIGIDKTIEFGRITFLCPECGVERDIIYPFNIIRKKYEKPKYCIKPSCKNKYFEIFKKDNYERGSFRIEDYNLENINNYLDCYVFRHYPYFERKTVSINLNDEVEVLGILDIDMSDFNTKKEIQEFSYYVDVLDVKIKKYNIIDEEIINTLKGKLKDGSYLEKLIDSFHFLTYLIDIYYPIKLTSCLSFVTGGIWNKKNNIRDTLNSIIAGGGSTYKSSIQRDLEDILNRRYFKVLEGNKITKPGLIGTTERKSQGNRPQIRYGFLAMYSNGTVVFDEGQELDMEILNTLRCLEKGNNSIVQDAVNFQSDCKESIILTQNYKLREDGFYDFDEPLYKNLGWDRNNFESLIQRFDLYYNIPKPDSFIKIRELRNEELDSKGILLNYIAEDLEIESYKFPEYCNSIKDRISFLLFNYLHKAKKLYESVILPEEIKDYLRTLYKEIIDKDRANTEGLSMRALNTSFKLLKALGSLRLNEKVEEIDLNYFRQQCMKLIIPFRSSKIIEKKVIELNLIFQKICENYVFAFSFEKVPIEEIIEEIRAYIKRTFYNNEPDEKFEQEIENYMPAKYTLRENYKFKKILLNNKNWLKNEGYIIEKASKAGTFIKKIG